MTPNERRARELSKAREEFNTLVQCFLFLVDDARKHLEYSKSPVRKSLCKEIDKWGNNLKAGIADVSRLAKRPEKALEGQCDQ